MTDSASYRVLARHYRPSVFADLIGQEAMVRTLRHAIMAGRLPQAWMLTGVRGVGKTTTARLIAKALNCTGRAPKADPVEPCNQCEACRSIAEDRHVDVQEMDAASRTGVDDIREIIEGVRYGPVSATYKIYILDEVHMLSKNAFNALLKTLEEPPSHAKFIFATTEIRKVPVTVLSRCQRFDLRRIDQATLVAHFARLAALEKAAAEDEALKMIARAADGSVRDGLSLLDQALALGQGACKADDVRLMLGLGDRGLVLSLCEDVLQGAMPRALETFDAVIQSGCDPLQLLQDLAALIYGLTRARVLGDEGLSSDLPQGERELYERLQSISMPALARAWQILLKGIGETQSTSHPAQAALMVLVRLSYAAELPAPGDLIKKLRTLKPQQDAPVQTAPKISKEPVYKTASATAPAPEPALEEPQSFRELASLFAQKREGNLYAQICTYVHPVRLHAGKLEIRLEKGAPAQLAVAMASCLSKWTGQRWVVTLVDEEGAPTLGQEDKINAEKRHAHAQEHPLMRQVVEVFPEATLVALTKKEVAPDEPKEEDGAVLESLDEEDD
ncbi:MAG: DNA polymerase III subunit gamma/tau [Alphaproteobacteria bacterium]|nr:DNA polymerase III subunit gamma/tau [Alphaproteobacteria bacterium]